MKSFEINMKRFGKNQSKKKKSKWKNVIIPSVLLIIIFVGCAYKVENLIQSSVVKLSVDNDVNATWIGSLASFWGGILGGIFSGIIAVFGVFYTIQFTRGADRNKLRQSIQPFLNVNKVTSQYNYKNNSDIKQFQISGVNRQDDKLKPQSLESIYLEITNIGNGFANTITFGTGENYLGIAYKDVFTINETKIVRLNVPKQKLNEGFIFNILFLDSMANEYVQEYEIRHYQTGEKYYIDVGHPELIERD